MLELLSSSPSAIRMMMMMIMENSKGCGLLYLYTDSTMLHLPYLRTSTVGDVSVAGGALPCYFPLDARPECRLYLAEKLSIFPILGVGSYCI